MRQVFVYFQNIIDLLITLKPNSSKKFDDDDDPQDRQGKRHKLSRPVEEIYGKKHHDNDSEEEEEEEEYISDEEQNRDYNDKSGQLNKSIIAYGEQFGSGKWNYVSRIIILKDKLTNTTLQSSNLFISGNEMMKNLEDRISVLETKVQMLITERNHLQFESHLFATYKPLSDGQKACIGNMVRNDMLRTIKFLTPQIMNMQGQKIIDRCLAAAEIDPRNSNNVALVKAITSCVKRTVNVTKSHYKRNIQIECESKKCRLCFALINTSLSQL
jgi:hypothetical protein